MINILDNNALIAMEKANLFTKKEHSAYMTEEIRDEFVIGKKEESFLSKCVFVDIHSYENMPHYLSEYKRLINKYNLISFYNFRGFGDMSILATICMVARTNPFPQLFPIMNVVTSDPGLISSINSEFPDNNIITVQDPKDWLSHL